MSYFKQLAARTSGNLPILKPPRSPFPQLGTTQAIESFAERIVPITPTAQSFSTSDRAARLSPRSRIEPTGTASDLVEKSSIDSPQIDTVLPTSPVTFEKSTEPNSPPTFEEPKSSPSNLGSAEAIVNRQSSSSMEIDSPQERLPRIRSVPQLNLERDKIKITSTNQPQNEEITIDRVETTQPKLLPNSPLEFRSGRDRGDEKSESKEIKRDRLPRLSPRDNNFSATDENLSSSIESRLPVRSVPNSASTNRIQIGSIEIQIIPPASPPLPVIPVAKTAIRSTTSTTSLSKGFNSSFGLRQG
jgi:hypothetical protein